MEDGGIFRGHGKCRMGELRPLEGSGHNNGKWRTGRMEAWSPWKMDDLKSLGVGYGDGVQEAPGGPSPAHRPLLVALVHLVIVRL